MLVRHWMDRKICNNATDGEMVINHDIFAEMNGYGIRGYQFSHLLFVLLFGI